MPPLCRSCPALWLGPSPLPHTDLLLVNKCCCPIRKTGRVCTAHASKLQVPSVFRPPNFQGYYRIDKQRKASLLPGVGLPKASCCEREPSPIIHRRGVTTLQTYSRLPVLDGRDHCWAKTRGRPPLPLTDTTPKLSNQESKP